MAIKSAEEFAAETRQETIRNIALLLSCPKDQAEAVWDRLYGVIPVTTGHEDRSAKALERTVMINTIRLLANERRNHTLAVWREAVDSGLVEIRPEGQENDRPTTD